MAILFECPSCHRQFRIKEPFRGTRRKCPGCKVESLVDGPHVQGYDVFISYSTRDQQVADGVCAAMESKGVRCWMAPRDIPAGASWGAAIIEGIEDSRLLLLMFSENSNRSDQVLREVERAVAKKIPLVPLRIDATPPGKAFEYFLASCHWLDVTGGALEDHLSTLTSTVRAMLLERAERSSVDAFAPTAASRPAARATWPLWLKVTLPAAIIAIAILSIAIVLLSRNAQPETPDAAPVATATAIVPPVDVSPATQSPVTTATTTTAAAVTPATAPVRLSSVPPASQPSTTPIAAATVPAPMPPIKTPIVKVEPIEWREQMFTHDAPVTSVVLDPDRDVLIAATAGGVVQRWNLKTGELNGAIGPTPRERSDWIVSGLAMSPDNGRLAITRTEPDGGPTHLSVWRVDQRRLLHAFVADGKSGVDRPWFSVDGDSVVVTRSVGAVRSFDLTTQQEGQRIDIRGPNRLRWVDTCLSRDRTWLFVAMAGEGVAARDAATGNMKHRYGADLPRALCVTVAKNNRLVAAGFEDGVVRVWRTQSRQLVATLKHDKPVRAVSFIGPENRLVAGDDGGAAIVWDADTGEAVQRLHAHDGPINCLSVSWDGKLATGSADKTARTWRLDEP